LKPDIVYDFGHVFYTILLAGVALPVGFKLGADTRRYTSGPTFPMPDAEPTDQAAQTQDTSLSLATGIDAETYEDPEASSDSSSGKLEIVKSHEFKSVQLDDLGELESYLYDSKPCGMETAEETFSHGVPPSDPALDTAMTAVINLFGDSVPVTCTPKYTHRTPKWTRLSL
jgi:hypothetical protein